MKYVFAIFVFFFVSACTSIPEKEMTEEQKIEKQEQRRKDAVRADTDAFRSCQIDRCY